MLDIFVHQMNFLGELGKVEANWFDADTFEGQCVKRISQGVWEVPEGGKNILDYTSNERLCFFLCQEARRQPRRPFRSSPLLKPWMTGCEFDASRYTCYSHTSVGLQKGDGQSGSKCVIYKTLAEEPGECVHFEWQKSGSRKIANTESSFERKKYRHRYPGVTEPRACLAKCLEELGENKIQSDSFDKIGGCEYQRPAVQQFDDEWTEGPGGRCEAIRVKFEGGSLQPNSVDAGAGLKLCWKLQELSRSRHAPHGAIRLG